MNLNQLKTLKKKFNCNIGLADHIDGGSEFAIILPLLAVPLGVSVIEKHITLNRSGINFNILCCCINGSSGCACAFAF